MTFEEIEKNETIRAYISKADESLVALGYTEHSFAHVTHVATMAGYLLETLGYRRPHRRAGKDRGLSARYRQSGQPHRALAERRRHGVPDSGLRWASGPRTIATIVTAIGNHDEGTGVPVNAVAAALILADKADVRRSRVRNQDTTTFDIHDRVNYSVKKSTLKINEDRTLVKLKLTVDTHFGSVMDYFEIFMQRMILCRKAAEKLGPAVQADHQRAAADLSGSASRSQ